MNDDLGIDYDIGGLAVSATFLINITVFIVVIVQTYREGFQAMMEPPGSYCAYACLYVTMCLIKIFTIATNTFEEQHNHILGLHKVTTALSYRLGSASNSSTNLDRAWSLEMSEMQNSGFVVSANIHGEIGINQSEVELGGRESPILDENLIEVAFPGKEDESSTISSNSAININKEKYGLHLPQPINIATVSSDQLHGMINTGSSSSLQASSSLLQPINEYSLQSSSLSSSSKELPPATATSSSAATSSVNPNNLRIPSLSRAVSLSGNMESRYYYYYYYYYYYHFFLYYYYY